MHIFFPNKLTLKQINLSKYFRLCTVITCRADKMKKKKIPNLSAMATTTAALIHLGIKTPLRVETLSSLYSYKNHKCGSML